MCTLKYEKQCPRNHKITPQKRMDGYKRNCTPKKMVKIRDNKISRLGYWEYVKTGPNGKFIMSLTIVNGLQLHCCLF